jgi:hypothetical protein
VNIPTESEEKLAKFVDQALRGLPARRAPHSLESRILSELQRRAALPWWRFSFAHWPVGARVAFVLICTALVGATFLGGVSAYLGDRSFNEVAALVLSWIQPLLAVMSSAGALVALLIRVIPPLWLYGGLVLGTSLYVALFGLGAAAYRTLYLKPGTAGNSL